MEGINDGEGLPRFWDSGRGQPGHLPAGGQPQAEECHSLSSAEAWSALAESKIKRLKQVYSANIKGLVNGHSKTPVVFII